MSYRSRLLDELEGLRDRVEEIRAELARLDAEEAPVPRTRLYLVPTGPASIPGALAIPDAPHRTPREVLDFSPDEARYGQ